MFQVQCQFQGSKWYFIIFSNFPSTDWPQFSPLTGNHLGPLFSLWPLTGAGSWLAQVSRNKRSRYGQFPYYPQSPVQSPAQARSSWKVTQAMGQFSLWGAVTPGQKRSRGRDKYNHSTRLAFARLNKQKRCNHRAYPPARQIFTGILSLQSPTESWIF